jgi:hypothetical protein
MDFEGFMNALVEAFQGVNLSSIHDVGGLAETLASMGIEPSAFSADQLEYMLQHMPHDALHEVAATVAQPHIGHGSGCTTLMGPGGKPWPFGT